MNEAAYHAILRRLGVEPANPPIAGQQAVRFGPYAYPWPDSLPALGARQVGPFDHCLDCERWSWARYGSVVLCLDCARRRSEPVA